MSGLNEKIAALNAEKAALVTEAHGLRGEVLVKQSVQVQTKLVEEATQVAFEKEQATEVAHEKEQALMLKKQQALEVCVEELRKQIAELEEGQAATKVKMSELVDREKTLSTEKSDLLLLKLKESSEVDTVDAQLSSGVDAKTSKALKSLRNKLQERLANTIYYYILHVISFIFMSCSFHSSHFLSSIHIVRSCVHYMSCARESAQMNLSVSKRGGHESLNFCQNLGSHRLPCSGA